MDRYSEVPEATPCPAITFEPGPKSHYFETPEADRPIPSIENCNILSTKPRVKAQRLPQDHLRKSRTALGTASNMPTEDTDDSDPKKLQSIFTFQKGVNGKGQPYFTVSQVVAASGIVFRGLPDVGGVAKSRKIAESHFQNKAVLGALVLIDKNGGAHILKTATSANVGEGVELLGTVRPSQLLWQPLWRKRVIKLAPMLRLKLGSIFDAAGAKDGCKKEDIGRYHASHVEKKLATFLLYMMLNEYGIKVGKYATCENIRKLKRRITSDPRRIRFELLISRKWCGMCLAYIRRVSSASGLEISLRVQPIVDAASITSRDYKGYRVKYATKEGGTAQAMPRRAQNSSAIDTAFTDEELQAFDDLELDDGQDDVIEDDKKAKAQAKQAEAFDLPLRSGLSESCVPAQNEEGDDLFCPLYDEASKADMAARKTENKCQADVGAELATLTIREERELFGTPGVGVAPMADMGEYGNPRLEGAIDGTLAIDRLPSLTYPSPEPAGDGGDEDDLFVPLNPAYTAPVFPAMQQPIGPASPSPESQSPGEETPEPVVIDITETPPPPSAAQVAAFARNFAAPFLYKSQIAMSATTEARPRKKPKPVTTARERVFQKKPLPATPVTTEPVGLRDGAVESLKKQDQTVAEYDFDGCEDPVFTQLEIERYG